MKLSYGVLMRLLVILLSLLPSIGFGLEKSDLLGLWEYETKGKVDERSISSGWQRYEFHEDGTFQANGLVILAWIITDEEQFPKENFQKVIKVAGLKEHFLEEEKEILNTPREQASEQFTSKIGWTMENMWALAWVLGFELELDIDDGQSDGEMFKKLVGFLKSAFGDKKAFVKNLKMRSEFEIVQMEDLFYCCHNAVRSAQTGNKNVVPKYFHPIKHGGIIHEKRHALTWVLSPGVEWDETDLST